jgi:RNA 2',3'-cyclic 3'-phosphodiesterase
MRLFVAIYPTPEALDDLTGQLARLRVGTADLSGVDVRLVARENAHVTVVFLGELDDAQLPEVDLALGRAARAWQQPPGTTGPGGVAGVPWLRLGGGGLFGQGPSTVLWVGLRGDVDALHAVSLAVRRELTRSGLPCDQRPYVPHLTIARPGTRVCPEAVVADWRTLDGYLGPSWPATEMLLMRSRLGPRPGYDRLAAWPL